MMISFPVYCPPWETLTITFIDPKLISESRIWGSSAYIPFLPTYAVHDLWVLLALLLIALVFFRSRRLTRFCLPQ